MLAGNILIGGIIGTGVDAVSGANNKLIPERVNVALESGEGTSEVPHFTTPADEEFYQKNILKPAQDKAKKEEEAAAKAKTASAPTTNFAAKSAAPATQVQ
jgi:hypothetical protein